MLEDYFPIIAPDANLTNDARNALYGRELEAAAVIPMRVSVTGDLASVILPHVIGVLCFTGTVVAFRRQWSFWEVRMNGELSPEAIITFNNTYGTKARAYGMSGGWSGEDRGDPCRCWHVDTPSALGALVSLFNSSFGSLQEKQEAAVRLVRAMTRILQRTDVKEMHPQEFDECLIQGLLATDK